jgi:hypothetical protein
MRRGQRLDCLHAFGLDMQGKRKVGQIARGEILGAIDQFLSHDLWRGFSPNDAPEQIGFHHRVAADVAGNDEVDLAFRAIEFQESPVDDREIGNPFCDIADLRIEIPKPLRIVEKISMSFDTRWDVAA